MNTDKQVCRQLASLMTAHGVRRVFISPGSRNAPIIVAVARCPQLTTTVVVDERSAAFMALGYASISGEPVALVCTSGTALLNYAPAIAEAYYRKLPLIVISADRPAEWIDQDDSQTLHQPGALSNYVKLSCDIPEPTTPNLLWYANRLINDVLLASVTGRRAPVHINVQLDAPLGGISRHADPSPRTISVVQPSQDIDEGHLRELCRRLSSSQRVLVITGFNAPDTRLNAALAQLAQRCPNIAVLTETIANLHSPHFISRIDTTLRATGADELQAMAPEIVITLGGALVSRFIKEYLRRHVPAEHWHVGISHTTIDCFRSLTLRVELDPGIFFTQIAAGIGDTVSSSDYSHLWHKAAWRGLRRQYAYVNSIGWSDFRAFAVFMSMVPRSYNLQLSNGTPIRYAQLIGDTGQHRSDCNRGVSGIDGCTSTAVGAALAYDGNTLLVTGDMSAQYDVGALASIAKTPRLKVIVMCNGGGGIFRFVKSTRDLDELDEYLSVTPVLPLADLCRGYGIDYYEAHDEESLLSVFPQFIADGTRAALLAVHTPQQYSAEVLRGFLD